MKKGEVKREVEKIRSLMKGKKFQEAVKSAGELQKKVSELSLRDRQSVGDELNIVMKEIALCVEINEAFVLAKEGNLKGLKNEIDHMHDVAFELGSERFADDVSSVLEYVDRYYKFFLDVYHYRLTIKEFYKKHADIEKAFEERDFHTGLKKYAELLLAYNLLVPVVDSQQRVQLYYKVKSLFKQVAVHRLMNYALEKPRRYEVIETNKFCKPGEDKQFVEKMKIPERKAPVGILVEAKPNIKVEDEFRQMRELLKAGKVDAAEKMYKRHTR